LLKKNNELADTEPLQQSLMLSFVLVISTLTSFIFSLAHLFFFERNIGFMLLAFFVIFTLFLILFKVTNKYTLVSFLTIIMMTTLFSLIILLGAGNKTGLMWGLTFPVIVAFTAKYRNYNIWSLLFLSINLIIFFTPNNISFWAKYSDDVIMRYLLAYIITYALIEFYLRLRQQAIYEREKELIETKHKLLQKDKFISSLSYEIRTPLNNIAGIINHQRDIINENVLEEIEMSVSNLAAIINKISEYTEETVLYITGKKTSYNINSIISRLSELFRTDKYSKLRLNLYLSDNVPDKVYGDRISFMQLLISSVDFFFNYSNENTLKLDIVSQKSEENSVIIKISGKYDNLIFPQNINTDRFLEDIKDLNIIKKISESLGGSVTILRNNNLFTLFFTFNSEILPDKDVQYKTQESLKTVKHYTSKKVKLKDANILLVEDDIINSKVMTLNIKKHVNKIIIAENGKEALDKFFETKVDIILMDIRMPFMDGFKTTEKIRKAEIGTGSHVPIIAVTANASSDVKKRCFEVGMNDYTTKPTNYKLLLKKMRKLLEE